jgi:hypothetical protein
MAVKVEDSKSLRLDAPENATIPAMKQRIQVVAAAEPADGINLFNNPFILYSCVR